MLEKNQKSRRACVDRSTKETQIRIIVDLDDTGNEKIHTGIGFFDHLLDSLRTHAAINLSIEAKGDLHIDGHHTVEDVGIVLGQALDQALGDRNGIMRFGFSYCPLDESLARAVVDLSGRPFFHFASAVPLIQVGSFAGELFSEFLRSFCNNAKMTLHVELLYGQNQHHAMEAMIKAVARALRMACALDPRQPGIPSTKGSLV